MSLLSSGRKVIEKSRSVGRKLCVQAVKGMELGKASACPSMARLFWAGHTSDRGNRYFEFGAVQRA